MPLTATGACIIVQLIWDMCAAIPVQEVRLRWRPNRTKFTGSVPTSEVKQEGLVIIGAELKQLPALQSCDSQVRRFHLTFSALAGAYCFGIRQTFLANVCGVVPT